MTSSIPSRSGIALALLVGACGAPAAPPTAAPAVAPAPPATLPPATPAAPPPSPAAPAIEPCAWVGDCAYRPDVPEGQRVLCLRGQCIATPVAESPAPSPCRTPADCPLHVRCVTGALGGQIGCTDGDCSEAAECQNGCATDADCPAVSPVCRGGGCRFR